jgi:hypothetical protein
MTDLAVIWPRLEATMSGTIVAGAEAAETANR